MPKIVKISESELIDIVKKVLNEQETEQQKKFNQQVLNFAKEVEVLKSQKSAGAKWDGYNNKGVKDCDPCKLTLTGTLQGDIDKKSYCINKKILDYGKWDCPEGYSLYSVIGKEYQVSSISPENQAKVLNLAGKLPTFKYVDPTTKVADTLSEWVKEVTKFIYENRHEILMIIAIGGMFVPIVGPLISLSADLADAGLYYGEGDKYTAGLTAIFGLLPAGQLLKNGIKSSPQFIKKVSKLVQLEKSGQLTEKYIAKNFTKSELESLKNLQKNASQLTYDAAKQASLKMSKTVFPKSKLGDIIKWYKNIKTKYPKSTTILGEGLTIGGVWYSWNKLSKIWGVSDKSDEKLSSSFSDEDKTKLEKVFSDGIIEQMKTVDQQKVATDMMNDLNKIIEQNKQTKIKNTKQSDENDDWMYK